jgi:hypothetical protein
MGPLGGAVGPGALEDMEGPGAVDTGLPSVTVVAGPSPEPVWDGALV